MTTTTRVQCYVPGCRRYIKSRGMCSIHAQRWARYGHWDIKHSSGHPLPIYWRVRRILATRFHLRAKLPWENAS